MCWNNDKIISDFNDDTLPVTSRDQMCKRRSLQMNFLNLLHFSFTYFHLFSLQLRLCFFSNTTVVSVKFES